MKRTRTAVASVMAFTFCVQSVAGAYPGEVFSSSSPMKAPDGTPAADRDPAPGHRIGEDGAAHYTIPIPTVPSRGGLVPQLSLSYSSRGAVRGGVAVGWTLEIPVIEPDTTRGVLAFHDVRSSLSRGRLVRVGPPAAVQPGFLGREEYRAHEDGGGIRYLRVVDTDGTAGWEAYSPDGLVYHFGETGESRDVESAATLGMVVGDGRFFVTRIVDRYHNEIAFTYEHAFALIKDKDLSPSPVDVVLTAVEYGRNPPAGLDHHARILFDHAADLDLCTGSQVPIGALYDLRTGYPLFKGARRLDAVRLEVKENGGWRASRRLDLRYDEDELACELDGSLHAPLRLLEAVSDSATAPGGAVTAQPPVRFEYGRLERDFSRAVNYAGLDLGSGQQALSPDKGGGWPTVDAMLLDLDGDGTLDPLASHRHASGNDRNYCEGGWRPNSGAGFGAESDFGMSMPDRPAGERYLPTVAWANGDRQDDWSGDTEGMEDCSLSAQFSRASNREECGYAADHLSYRFLDVTGDGLPDLVTGLDTQRGRYAPELDEALWPDTASCEDPLDCACPDSGACLDADGNEALCEVIDLPGTLFSPNTGPSPCDGGDTICCPVGEDANILSNTSAPIQAKDSGNPGASLMKYIGMVLANATDRLSHHNDLAVQDTPATWRNPDPACQMYPENRCGHYIMRVHDNLGDGRFAEQARLVYAPIPLETDRPTSSLGAGHLAASSAWHGFVDLDGDGLLDAVYKEPVWMKEPAPDLQVFRGDGSGSFDDDAFVWPTDSPNPPASIHVTGGRTLSWLIPPPIDPWVRTSSHPGVTASFTSVTLEDMNGDGLPDYVDARQSPDRARRLRVLFNTGRGFEPRPPWYDDGTTLHEDGDKSLQYWNEEQQWQDRVVGNAAASRGFSRSTWRSVDIDSDGLVDLVRLPPISPDDAGPVRPYASGFLLWEPEIYFNVGDGFVRATHAPLDTIWRALARIRITDAATGSLQGTWSVLTDFVDLDGDGLPEAVNNDDNGADACRIDLATERWNAPCAARYNNALTDPQDGQALRALRRVDNGKGATIEMSYAPVRTSGRVPHPIWVVTQTTVSPGPDADGVASPAMVTGYAYDDASYAPDLERRWGFRGFGTVEVTAPAGARTVTTRDFSLDYGGLVVDRRVYDAGGRPASITATEHEPRRLFETLGADAVISYHPIETVTHTCEQGEDDLECASNDLIARTSTEWRSLTPQAGDQPTIHVLWRTETSPGYGIVEGAVGQTHEQRVIQEPGAYWLLTDAELSWSRGPGGAVRNDGEIYTYYDPTRRAATAISTRTEPGGPFAVVSRDVDLATGVLRAVQSPRFFGQTAGWTRFEHDVTRTFVTRTTNAAGHVVDTRTDPATGVVIESRGPNQKSCAGCPGPVRDGWSRTIDGLGRTLTEHTYVDDATLGYRLEQVARYTYVDAPTPRPRVVEERRLQVGSPTWTKQETQVDGLGRTVRTAQYESGSERSYARSYYDAAGNVVRARLPKPGAYFLAFVDWTYAYDSLGRTVAAREPSRPGCTGAIGSAGWCGQQWSYDGRTLLAEDVTGTAGGAIARTRTTRDFLGRLALAEEDQGGGDWAETRYHRDGRGNVDLTVSADGVTTDAEFDLLGRRTAVTRGGETWRFGYDLDGHLTSISSPVPQGAAPEDYVTSLAYDDLGRLTSELGAPRDWTPSETSLLGEPIVSRTYDDGVNGVGRLTHVEEDSGTIDYTYDAAGRVARETHGFSILDGDFHDERTIERTYNLQGQPEWVTTADGPTPMTSTKFLYQYNTRGLPTLVHWFQGYTHLYWLQQVIHDAGGNAFHRNWYSQAGNQLINEAATGFDDAGRITRYEVRSRLPGAPGLTTRALEEFYFDGASDVHRLDTVLSDGVRPDLEGQAAYTYDAQHRLYKASAPHQYQAVFEYSPGGRITRAQVDASPTAARVHSRDVSYEYGGPGADPDAPVALISQGTGDPWMTLRYDRFGNAIERAHGDASFEHLYDGFDRQRAVRTEDGTELYWYGPDGARSLVATLDASGQIERVKWTVGEAEIWYRGDGTIEKEVAYADLAGARTRIEDHANRETLYNDPRGNLLAVLSDTGALKAGFQYGPYGELLDEIGPESGDFRHRFNGKEHDDASSLDYYGFRYYDERTLTWTQADPKYRMVVEKAGAEPRRASLYAFSLGNPVSMVDPDGGDTIAIVNGRVFPGNGRLVAGRASAVALVSTETVLTPVSASSTLLGGSLSTRNGFISLRLSVTASYSVAKDGVVTFRGAQITGGPEGSSHAVVTVGIASPQQAGAVVTSRTQAFTVAYEVRGNSMETRPSFSVGMSGKNPQIQLQVQAVMIPSATMTAGTHPMTITIPEPTAKQYPQALPWPGSDSFWKEPPTPPDEAACGQNLSCSDDQGSPPQDDSYGDEATP